MKFHSFQGSSELDQRSLERDDDRMESVGSSHFPETAQDLPPGGDSPSSGASARGSILDWPRHAAGIVGGLLMLAAVFALPSLRISPSRWFGRRRVAARRQPNRQKRKISQTSAPAPLVDEASTFAALREAIFGQTKRQIASVFGPPPVAGCFTVSSVVPLSPAVAGAAPVAYLSADVWYYPFNRHQHSAIALRFSHNRLASVVYIAEAA